MQSRHPRLKVWYLALMSKWQRDLERCWRLLGLVFWMATGPPSSEFELALESQAFDIGAMGCLLDVYHGFWIRPIPNFSLPNSHQSSLWSSIIFPSYLWKPRCKSKSQSSWASCRTSALRSLSKPFGIFMWIDRLTSPELLLASGPQQSNCKSHPNLWK